jgi:hypothetical protein
MEKTEILAAHSLNDSSGPQRCGECYVASDGIALNGIACRYND